ncbi:hypothetical protein KI387_027770, partial [Taxus chinensis]
EKSSITTMGGGRDATISSDSDSLDATIATSSWSAEEESGNSEVDDSVYAPMGSPVLCADKLKECRQVGGELGFPQNIVIPVETCQSTTESLLSVLGGIQFSKAGGDCDSTFARLEGEGSNTEVGFEGNHPE